MAFRILCLKMGSSKLLSVSSPFPVCCSAGQGPCVPLVVQKEYSDPCKEPVTGNSLASTICCAGNYHRRRITHCGQQNAQCSASGPWDRSRAFCCGGEGGDRGCGTYERPLPEILDSHCQSACKILTLMDQSLPESTKLSLQCVHPH